MLFYELLESNEQEMTVMKKLISSALISWFVGFAVSANAGPFEDGVAAYERKDYVTAAKLMRVAADQGNSVAQYELGVMYDEGRGVIQDYKEAVKWFRLSADQGNARAQFNLGVMYVEGQGVTQDFKEAVKWYRLSADQRDAIAQSNLGFMYANGQGVTQDYVRAHMWWNISASSGHKNSEANRDKVTMKMTPTQIEKAQEMARLCMKTNYKNCD